MRHLVCFLDHSHGIPDYISPVVVCEESAVVNKKVHMKRSGLASPEYETTLI